ncbi:MAG: DUF1727 domain-containing protein, partial [Chloroflexi bacterium]|nr:DUF1727 domain-containing protein [Chloroflexota bacterium]
MISRTLEAIALGKLIGIASRALGRGGGTALPGLLAQKLDPNLVSYLASQISCGSIMVTGTNGKTTTSRMIASLLRQNQLYPLHNSSGSNLMRGIATTLVEKATWIRSQPFSEESIGLFEVDEATLPQAIAEIKPKMVIITNLFRDQLDRYGEIDAVASRWQETLASLPDTATVVLNSDDPVVASLGENLVANALYYGIEDTTSGHDQMEHAADSRWCPHCAVDYSYLLSYYGHLGHYYCSHCERQRPQPQIKALRLRPKGFAGTEIDLATPTGMTSITIDIPGVYNVYNVLAAVAGAFAWGVPLPIIQKGLQGFTAAFGRGERIKIDNKEICLVLAKNPVGLNEVLRTLSADGLPKGLLLILNDD